MKFSLVLPTRKRVSALKELIESIIATTNTISEVELCIYVDLDDDETKSFVDTFDKSKFSIKYCTSPDKIKLSAMWNYAYDNLATGDIIMLCADDIRFRTIGWDTIVSHEFDKLSDKIILVHGNDLYEGRATHSFVHRRWIEISGFWLPPYFSGDYPDTWLDEVATALNRKIYLSTVITEHMHFTLGKSQLDDTTILKKELESKYNPYELYISKIEERKSHIKKLSDNIIKPISNFRVKFINYNK